MRKIIITAAAVITAALVLACGAGNSGPKFNGIDETPEAVNAQSQAAKGAPQGPKKFAVGEHGQLTLGDGSTADVVVSSVKVQGKSVVATITIKCTAGSITYNEFDWSATDADGTKLDPAFDPSVKNGLSHGDLGAGQTVSGTSAFEGSTAKGVSVMYAPSFSTLAYWVNP